MFLDSAIRRDVHIRKRPVNFGQIGLLNLRDGQRHTLVYNCRIHYNHFRCQSCFM